MFVSKVKVDVANILLFKFLLVKKMKRGELRIIIIFLREEERVSGIRGVSHFR